MKILTHPKHGENVARPERTASAIAGALLVVQGLRSSNRNSGLITLLAGAELLRRGLSGRCYLYHLLGITTAEHRGASISVPYPVGIRVDCSITVDRPPTEAYRFWRNLENLPVFMEHLASVKVIDEARSHWIAKAPAGTSIEWDAEIVNDIENKLIGWRSLPDSQVQNAGSVHFEPEGNGTKISVELQYNPPAGVLGAAVARMFGEEPTQQIREDLQRFKEHMESKHPA
jgi:uncharacterized membrane protein